MGLRLEHLRPLALPEARGIPLGVVRRELLHWVVIQISHAAFVVQFVLQALDACCHDVETTVPFSVPLCPIGRECPGDVERGDPLARDGVFMACSQALIVLLLRLFVFLLLVLPLLVVLMPVVQELVPSSMAM